MYGISIVKDLFDSLGYTYIGIWVYDNNTPTCRNFYSSNKFSDKVIIQIRVNQTSLWMEMMDYYDGDKLITYDFFGEYHFSFYPIGAYSLVMVCKDNTTIYAEHSNVNFPYYYHYTNGYFDSNVPYDFGSIFQMIKMENAIYQQNDYYTTISNQFSIKENENSLIYSNYSNSKYMYGKCKKLSLTGAYNEFGCTIDNINFNNFLCQFVVNYTENYVLMFGVYGRYTYFSFTPTAIIIYNDISTSSSVINYYHKDNIIDCFVGYNGTNYFYGLIVGNRFIMKNDLVSPLTSALFYIKNYAGNLTNIGTNSFNFCGFKYTNFPIELNNHHFSTSLWLDYKFNFDFFYPTIRNWTSYNFKSEQFNLPTLPSTLSGYTINYYSVKSIVLIATQIISDNCMYKYLSNNQIISDFYTISVSNGTIVLLKYWLDWKHIDYYVNNSFLWYYTSETNNSFFVQDLYFTITWDLYVSQNVDTTITVSINIILPLLLLFLFPYAFYQALGKKGAIFGLIFGFIVFGICQLIETLYMYLLVALSVLIVVYYLKNQRSEEL